MAKLTPLEQWYCDHCHQLIKQPAHGYLEWLTEDRGMSRYGFKVVHHALHSPNRNEGGNCYYSDNKVTSSCSLDRVLGSDGLAHLSSWIDVGEEIDEVYSGPEVTDLRAWVVLLRRLHLPYYEEAKQYLETARRDDYRDLNEHAFYSQEILKEIIERYSEE